MGKREGSLTGKEGSVSALIYLFSRRGSFAIFDRQEGNNPWYAADLFLSLLALP